MNEPNDPLANVPSVTVELDAADPGSGLPKLAADLAAIGADVDLDEARKTSDSLAKRVAEKRMAPGLARQITAMRVRALANRSLVQRRDRRRLERVLAVGGARVQAFRWVLVTRDERLDLERAGVRFDATGRGLPWRLASLPAAIAMAIFVVRAIRHGETVDWICAAAAYVAWFVIRRVLSRRALSPAS